jgi:hypothetical protein
MDKIAEKKAKDRTKRQDARMAKMMDGFLELERWLCDLVRKGIMSYPDYPKPFWDNAVSRLVDGQAPGAANMLRKLRDLNYSDGRQWQDEALYWTIQLWTLSRGFTQLPKQSKAIQQQLLTAAGWGPTPKEVQADSSAFRVSDFWVVVGRQVEKIEEITVQRNWLYGIESGRFALVLYFAFKNTPIESAVQPGKCYKTSMVFFPQSDRALLEHPEEVHSDILSIQAHANWHDAEAYLSEARITSPWMDVVPIWVRDITVARMADGWCLVDSGKRVIVLSEQPATKTMLSLLGKSRGMPVTVFFAAGPKGMTPLAVWVEGTIAIL